MFFKIEEDILSLLRAVKKVLAPDCKLFHFSSHSQGFSPEVLKNLAGDILPLEKFSFEGGEMLMPEQGGKLVPSGQFIRLWR